jgi:hypothetical protein
MVYLSIHAAARQSEQSCKAPCPMATDSAQLCHCRTREAFWQYFVGPSTRVRVRLETGVGNYGADIAREPSGGML